MPDLTTKLQGLLKLRIWHPSSLNRRPELGDHVLVRDTPIGRSKEVVGKVGRIVRDDKDSKPYRLKIVNDPFAPQKGASQSDVGHFERADLTLVRSPLCLPLTLYAFRTLDTCAILRVG